jgi:glycosyltransferase involved in cell wall biosynthesis
MISIAMPTYESFGRGVEFLEKHFEMFQKQTYQDFEVVISDHSLDKDIEEFCSKYRNQININYERNPHNRGNFTDNTNRAIKRCKGDIVKVLFQDDFLRDEDSLKKINDSFEHDIGWLVTSCEHTHNGVDFVRRHDPVYNDKIYTGNNTIGNPSVLAMANKEDMPLFDERFVWAVDVDLYKRLHDKYGPPKILNEVTVVIRLWNRQMTHLISPARKNEEIYYSTRKHENE